ncbi:hypothetical protein [Streptomyces sp. NPDC057325]|uniref:hypothetical protein n=1 Tax=unclassified Streptomyces TaxID=2593676 RepID=UPI00362B3990
MRPTSSEPTATGAPCGRRSARASPGPSAVESLILADVHSAERPEGVPAVNAFTKIASFRDGRYRVMGWNRRDEVPDDAPLDLGGVRDVTRRALGSGHGVHEAR